MLTTPRRRLVLPVLSGVLLGLVFYKTLPGFLAFLALVPFLVFLDQARGKREAALGGFLVGGTYFAFVLHTLAFVEWFGFVSSEHLFMQFVYVALCLLTGISYALFALGSRLVPRRSLFAVAYLPALFVIVEYTKRAYAFGFTWGFLGYLAEDMPHVLLGSTLAGVLGLSFLIVLANVSLTLALLEAVDRRRGRAIAALSTVAAACVVFLAGGWAVERFALREVGTVRVAVMETRGQLGSLELNVPPYTELVAEAKQTGAQIIVMPESLIDPKRKEVSTEDMAAVIGRLAGDYAGTLVVGGFRNDGGARYNSTFFWRAGAIESTYDKHFLVPFAEYAPTLLSAVSPAGKTLYTPGAAEQLPAAGGVAFGSLVCQEVNYPEAGIRAARSGAEILVSGANDGFVHPSKILSWIAPTDAGHPWFQQIEYRYARFRAVETGRYLLRSTKVGIAGIISPTGESVESIPSDERGVRVRDVALMGGLTPYVRFGDAPLLLASLLCCLWVWRKELGIRVRRS